jgi:hypothetical protein
MTPNLWVLGQIINLASKWSIAMDYSSDEGHASGWHNWPSERYSGWQWRDLNISLISCVIGRIVKNNRLRIFISRVYIKTNEEAGRAPPYCLNIRYKPIILYLPEHIPHTVEKVSFFLARFGFKIIRCS